jgi:transposase
VGSKTCHSATGCRYHPKVLYQSSRFVTPKGLPNAGRDVVLAMTNGRTFVMAAPLALCSDFKTSDLRSAARRTRDANQAQWRVALAAIYEGGLRGEAARIGGVGLQVVRDWVLRFNAQGPDGLIDRNAPGASSRLNAGQRQALAAMIESGPMPAIHSVVRWRLADLALWAWEEFRIAVSPQAVSRELHALGYRKLSARPHHHGQPKVHVRILENLSPAGAGLWR